MNQDVPYSAKGFTAVAEAILFVLRNLGRCAADIGKQEYGIVTEAVATARLLSNNPLDEIGNDGERAPPVRKGDYANESRAALGSRLPLHCAEQLSHAVGIGSFWPRIPRRIHSRRAAERRNNQAGVLGDEQFIRKAAIVQRLSDGVLGKGRRSLFELG